MKLPDGNVLLYAVNTDSAHHEDSRRWLDAALSGGETVGFTWIALLAFVRLSTKVELFPSPLSVDEAMARVDAWLAAGPAVVVEPTSAHPRVLHQLLRGLGAGADLVNDAHLAALSLEHKGTVVSYDRDFSRFPGVRWSLPPSPG
ncbi:MAG: TA system VapC family ribonuclease toxin [Acidimicrobiales bacterium]